MTLAHHAQRAGNAAAAWFGFWSRFGLLGIAIGIALAGVVVWSIAGLIGAVAGALIALTVGLFAARFRWPKVKARHYFTTAKVTLPLALVLFGLSAQYLIADVFTDSPALLPALGWGVAFAACASLLIAIFEGKLMNSIFQLVPFDEQAALAQQLDNLDAGAIGMAGQAADFSDLDQAGVVAAIESRVIGQNHIVEAVVSTAFRRARLARTDKPVGVFCFVGATGAGKTELAKALSVELFAGRLIRIDCNELVGADGVARLVGPQRGYIGSDRGSEFCRSIGKLGSGVILFDEIEKADRAVMKTIMGLLDEARITEQASSRTYSARGFLIVLTSNAAADEIRTIERVETDAAIRETKIRDALQGTDFPPEVLARIEAIFPFAPLAGRDVARIIERFLLKFSGDVGVTLESCDSTLLLDLVTRSKKTAAYGIREVVRSVENAVVDGLLAVKDAGHKRAAIHVRDGAVHVEPVATETTERAAAAAARLTY